MTDNTVTLPTVIERALNNYQAETVREFLHSLTEKERHKWLQELTEVFTEEVPEWIVRESIVESIVSPFNMRMLNRQTEEMIEQHGWAVQSVFGEESEPSFAYTIGLSKLCGTELFCSGVGGQTAQFILNEIADQLKDNPQLSEQDLARIPFTIKGGTEDGRLRFTRVPLQPTLETRTLRVSQFVELTGEETLLVIVLSDANGVLPGEEGYDTNFRQLTPEQLTQG